MVLGVSTPASFSPNLLSSRFLSSFVSPIFLAPWRRIILAPGLLSLILPRSLSLILPRPLSLLGLALVISYETEEFSILDEFLNQDSEISALLGKVASGVVKRVEFVSILLSRMYSRSCEVPHTPDLF
jgi:hypothetical protein